MSQQAVAETAPPTQQELQAAEKIIKEQFPKLAPYLFGSRMVGYTPDQFDALMKNHEQRQLEYLEKQLGVFKTTLEKIIEAFTPKTTSQAQPSSQVQSEQARSANYEAINTMADILKQGNRSGAPLRMTLSKDEWLRSFGYNPDMAADGKGWNMLKKEALTSATQPITYNRQVIDLPGGQMVVPIRQFCNFTALSGADKAAWYTMGNLTYNAITEGTTPTEDTVTITQELATPTVRGSFLKIKYSQIEDNPFPLLETLANKGVAAAIDNEGTEILDTAFNAATMGTGHWINGNTGATLTSSDDVAGMTLSLTAVATAKQRLVSRGHTAAPVFALHPKNWADLVVNSGLVTFVQQGMPEITRTGVMEALLGIALLQTDNVNAANNTTNDTYRNVMFLPGKTFLLASSRDVTVKAEEHSELQQLFWTSTHRIDATVAEASGVYSAVRISCAQ